LLSPPDVSDSPAHVTTVPWAAPSPSLWSAVASARLQVGGTAEWSFWSEAWTAHATVLTSLVSALRASRPGRRVDIDDGWHTDRDLSIAVGQWGWLHVRALVEEHAAGRCLCRIAARLQPSVRGILLLMLLSAALLGASSAAIALRWPWVTMAALGTAVGLFVSAAWQTTRSVAVLDRALSRVTTQSGMMPLPGRTGRARLTWRPSTVLHKGQAALVMGLVTSGFVVSGFVLTRDVIQTAEAPVRQRPRITMPAAPPARLELRPTDARLELRPTEARNDLRRPTGSAPVGAAIRQRRDDAQNRLRAVPAPPTTRRVPRRTA
ncbi:MAG: hypothetical protein ABI880_02520, partial [Acidobacteriota bacterium]